jgi:hypothetical protein
VGGYGHGFSHQRIRRQSSTSAPSSLVHLSFEDDGRAAPSVLQRASRVFRH